MKNNVESELKMLVDSRPLITVLEKIYFLAKDFSDNWISFLDKELKENKDFFSQFSEIQENNTQELNEKILKKAGFDNDQTSHICDFFNTLQDVIEWLDSSVDTQRLEVFEKCAYFILYNYGYIILNPLLSKKLHKIFKKENLPNQSIVLKLCNSFFYNDIAAGYEAFVADASFVIKFLRNSLEIVKNNLQYMHYIEAITPLLLGPYQGVLDAEQMRKYLLSINIAGSAYFIIFWSALPSYYISLDDDETVNSFINEAVDVESDIPLVMLVDGFRKMDDDSLEAELMLKKAVEALNNLNLPELSMQQSLAYFGLALIHQRRMIYDKAEDFFNQSLSFNIPDFLRAIITVNRGKNFLDKKDLARAKKDFLKCEKYPHVEASAHTNLGKIYFIQNFFDKAEAELIKALEINPSLAVAYYNLGVLYTQKRDKEKAKKYFQLTLQADSSFPEARTAIQELEESNKPLIDWWSWWFEFTSAYKKIVGIFTMTLISILFIFMVYQLINQITTEFLNSYFIMIGFLIAFLILPTLSKLKIGPMEVEMKSVGSTEQ
jgi:tetratricopeptide (TPR) repeat protein